MLFFFFVFSLTGFLSLSSPIRSCSRVCDGEGWPIYAEVTRQKKKKRIIIRFPRKREKDGGLNVEENSSYVEEN